MKLVVTLLLFGGALAGIPFRKNQEENVIDVYVVQNQGGNLLTPLIEGIKDVPMTGNIEVLLDPSPLSIKVPQVVSSPNFEELQSNPVIIAKEITSDDDKEGNLNDYAFYYCPTGLTCLERSDNFQNIKEDLMSGEYNKALYFYPNKNVVNHLFSGNEDVQRWVVPEDLKVQGVINLAEYKIPFFLVRTLTQFSQAENELSWERVGQVVVSGSGVDLQPSGDGGQDKIPIKL